MSDMTISRYGSNEIAKQDDFNYGEQQGVENINALLGRLVSATNDVVMQGLVVQERGAPSMNVDITAGVAFCQSTGKMAYIGSLFGPVAIANGSGSDRIDVVEIRVTTTNFDAQQRAFRDPASGSISYQDWDTKTRYEIEAQVIQGTPGAGVAPSHTAGWIKVAEVLVSAGESTAIYDADIENVTGGYDTEVTTNWTTETAATFKLQNWEEVKALFRTNHDEDGDHSDDSIKDNHIDWGTGAGQVSAVDVPIADSGGLFTATDVENALAEAATNILAVTTYDRVIHSQDEFNDAIERVAANQYKIKDGIRSVFIKYLSGGYQMTGGSSPLSGGDTWGYIETNQCAMLISEPTAFIDMGQNIGYIRVNTDHCLLDGVSVQGDKGAASAIQRSFLLAANYVTFRNCESRARLSNTTFTVFEGSGTALNNQTSTVEGCRIEDITSSGRIYGFRYFYNMSKCVVYDVDSTAENVFCISDIINLSNVFIKQIDGNVSVVGIAASSGISNVHMEDMDATTNDAVGITGSYRIHNCYIYDLAAGGGCFGIENSYYISNCQVVQLDGATNVYGFTTNQWLSNCRAYDIDSSGGNAYGFMICEDLVNCNAYDAQMGFSASWRLTNCRAQAMTSHGFAVGGKMHGCRAQSNGGNGFHGSTGVFGSHSASNTGNGFQDCLHLEHNFSIGNAIQYNNSFADYAGTRAAGPSDSGGDNA